MDAVVVAFAPGLARELPVEEGETAGVAALAVVEAPVAALRLRDTPILALDRDVCA